MLRIVWVERVILFLSVQLLLMCRFEFMFFSSQVLDLLFSILLLRFINKIPPVRLALLHVTFNLRNSALLFALDDLLLYKLNTLQRLVLFQCLLNLFLRLHRLLQNFHFFEPLLVLFLFYFLNAARFVYILASFISPPNPLKVFCDKPIRNFILRL